jgi:hypothetical protein
MSAGHTATQGHHRSSGFDDSFRVTFTLPVQRKTVGGLISIQEFVTNLASRMNVNLVVQYEDPTPIPGVSVYRSKLISPDVVPDADAVVLFINSVDSEGFFSLPESKGERIFIFQGYNELESDLVRDRLRMGLRTMVISRWLEEEARRFGARPMLTPVGLDRAIFSPGPPTETRSDIVCMKVQPIEWKATPDGLAALSMVKEARPETEFHLWGNEPPSDPLPFDYAFSSPDSQAGVAGLLRQSAVFVCPSWEEGFGLPGLEALASGAGLATTDTKGSREYAIHEETALVSAPRKPELLAENVLRLLDDLELRRRLTRDGLEYARNHFKPWPEAAAEMGRQLIAGSERRSIPT